MENTRTINEQDILRELENEVQRWVNNTFNFIQLEVVDKFCDGALYEYIVRPDNADIVIDWLNEREHESLIKEFSETNEKELDFDEFEKQEGTVQSSFCKAYGDDCWQEFLDFLLLAYEYDIDDYQNEQENYPMWNTLFEFRESFYNNDTKACMEVGLGVIEGLEPFNNMLFMSSAGHSFYSAYWIPLYFALNTNAKEKFKGVDYSSL